MPQLTVNQLAHIMLHVDRMAAAVREVDLFHATGQYEKRDASVNAAKVWGVKLEEMLDRFGVNREALMQRYGTLVTEALDGPPPRAPEAAS